MLTPTDQASRATEVIDADAVAAELEGLVDVHAGNERELRLAVSRRLKAALVEGRAAAESRRWRTSTDETRANAPRRDGGSKTAATRSLHGAARIHDRSTT